MRRITTLSVVALFAGILLLLSSYFFEIKGEQVLIEPPAETTYSSEMCRTEPIQVARTGAETTEQTGQTGQMKKCTACSWSCEYPPQGGCTCSCKCTPRGCFMTKQDRFNKCNDTPGGILDPFCSCNVEGQACPTGQGTTSPTE